MNGDEFGPDGWADDHPGPGHDGDSGPSEPGVPEDHLSGEPHAGTGSGDLEEPGDHADGSAGSAGAHDPGAPDDPDHDGFGEDRDADDAEDAEPFEPDGDGGHPGATAAPGSPDRWTEAIGYGAADPGGTHPGFFDHVDLSSDGGAGSADPEWLTEELASARSTWVDPDLLDLSGPGETEPLGRASGEEAVTGLWDRLAPDTPMPSDPSGAPDLAGALAALEARAGAGSLPLRQVIDAARRLLDA